MTNGRVEVITSVERRRRWSVAEKRQLVAAALDPEPTGGSGGLSKSTLWLWAAADARNRVERFCAGAECERGWFCRVCVPTGFARFGIEAQREVVERFAAAEWLERSLARLCRRGDGKGSDALDRRPQLAAALA